MIKIQTGTDNTILRTRSEDILVREYDTYIKIGKEMIRYIKNKDNHGVGLAAPQIGYNKRLVVVSLLKDRDDESFPTVMMMNPVVLEHSTDTDQENEGCLSLPGEKGKVERFLSIKLTYIDESKKTKVVHLSGVSARIVQHEIDHLDGVLFVDRVEKGNKIISQ